jgi:hypothetical protein
VTPSGAALAGVLEPSTGIEGSAGSSGSRVAVNSSTHTAKCATDVLNLCALSTVYTVFSKQLVFNVTDSIMLVY